MACTCMKAEAGGWHGCSRSHAFSPVREAKLREREAIKKAADMTISQHAEGHKTSMCSSSRAQICLAQ